MSVVPIRVNSREDSLFDNTSLCDFFFNYNQQDATIFD